VGTRRVNDAGLELSDPDNLVSVGFGVPVAILGIAGRAFERLSFNLALNAPCSGGCLLTEAWLEGYVTDELRVRVGKFKTPMNWVVQTRLGGRLSPVLPTSLSTRVNIPSDLNALNPVLATGFDLGVMVQGVLSKQLLYQVGLFNGEGIGVNLPTSSLSDDLKIPGLLYAARVAWAPVGAPMIEEGGFAAAGELKVQVAASASFNVEANSESSNDLRAGLELVVAGKHWYWVTEGSLLQMQFVERLRSTPNRVFWGAYSALAHAFENGLEPFVRVDVFDRNSANVPGVLVMPGVGLNYYLFAQNLKLSALYQYNARVGYADRWAADDDLADVGEHTATVQLQFAL
jgi:hypothetical protein